MFPKNLWSPQLIKLPALNFLPWSSLSLNRITSNNTNGLTQESTTLKRISGLQTNRLSYKSGLQKDRDRGTTGPKEGLIPIGRFGLIGHFFRPIVLFLQQYKHIEGTQETDKPLKILFTDI